MDWRSSGTYGRGLVSTEITCVCVRVGYNRERGAHLAHGVVVLDERMHGLDREEGLVHDGGLRTGVQDIGSDDCCEVVNIHLRSGLLVHVRE